MVLVVLIAALRRLADRLDADRDCHRRSQPAPPDAAAAAGVRGDPVSATPPVCWSTGSRRTLDDRAAVLDQTPPHGARPSPKQRLQPTSCKRALAGNAAGRRCAVAGRGSGRGRGASKGPAQGRQNRARGGDGTPTTTPRTEEEAIEAQAATTRTTRRRSWSRPRRSRSCWRRSSTGSAWTPTIEMQEADGVLTGSSGRREVGLFIGRHGQTIDAVQHLAQRIVFPEGPSPVRVVVIDANGYRAAPRRRAAGRGGRRRRGGA